MQNKQASLKKKKRKLGTKENHQENTSCKL